MRDRTTREIAATAKAERKAQLGRILELIDHLDALIEAEPDDVMRRPDIMVALRSQRADLQGAVAQIKMQLRSSVWLYVGLLQRAVNEGKDLGYTSPPKGKGKPHGPGIKYLIDEAAKHGRKISPNRAHALIADFNKLSQPDSQLKKIDAKLDGIKSELKAHPMILRNGQLIDK
jgi:hypothetical protein